MGKYQFKKKELVRPYKIHPVWRGIGFLIMIIVPVMAWAGAAVLVEIAYKQGWAFMREMSPTLKLPDVFYDLPGISTIANRISSVPNLPALLLFFLALLIVLTGVMSFIYSVVYRIIGPPRYTPLDAPAPKTRAKRYTR
jgi:hypothetical protein